MSRIQRLLAESRRRKELSDEAYRLANERRAEMRIMIIAMHEYRAARKNRLSRQILDDPIYLNAIVDSLCSEDPTWNGHVEDQRFNERLANQAAAQANMEMMAALVQMQQPVDDVVDPLGVFP